MTDERDQSTRAGHEAEQDFSEADSGSSEMNASYEALILHNRLVDRDALERAMEVAIADGRLVLDVLVENGRITKQASNAITTLAKVVGKAAGSIDIYSDANLTTASPAEATDEETLPPNLYEHTATIPAGGPAASAVPNLSRQGSTSADTFGDYEIISEIARGGMGVVYKARQISLNRVVALKKVLSGQLAGEQDIQRFRIEAEASANLDHPGIVPVHDFGVVDGQHFFSMGFVEGRSLADRISESPLEPREAAELLIKIARAVAFANEKGVIHRDLKPGNVLLDRDGQPRVTDFGLAKQQRNDSGMTATGQILGTPSYMPPEQASGQDDVIDQRADVYALGAILYATLTGRPPFQAANPIATLKQVMEQEPVSIRQLAPDAPRDLETICLKCLQKDAEQRYASGSELADDLQRWLDGKPILARPVSKLERLRKWSIRFPVVAVLVGLFPALALNYEKVALVCTAAALVGVNVPLRIRTIRTLVEGLLIGVIVLLGSGRFLTSDPLFYLSLGFGASISIQSFARLKNNYGRGLMLFTAMAVVLFVVLSIVMLRIDTTAMERLERDVMMPRDVRMERLSSFSRQVAYLSMCWVLITSLCISLGKLLEPFTWRVPNLSAEMARFSVGLVICAVLAPTELLFVDEFGSLIVFAEALPIRHQLIEYDQGAQALWCLIEIVLVFILAYAILYCTGLLRGSILDVARIGRATRSILGRSK